MVCQHCSKEIEVGQAYYYWSRHRSPKSFTHVECGAPSPTMLSSAKTAVIEEAVGAVDLTSWDPTVPSDWDGNPASLDVGFDDVVSMLTEIADVARDVGSEYESGVDNMPEGLQQGSTGEAMREVAQELESWADDLESFEPNSNEPEWPERESLSDPEDDDEYRDAIETALSDWADEVRSDAEDKLGDMPTYNG
jgi:hypothetical protein